ncbi:hypothetical protein HaLaN_29545, partial [Haematococcus lacustris]
CWTSADGTKPNCSGVGLHHDLQTEFIHYPLVVYFCCNYICIQMEVLLASRSPPTTLPSPHPLSLHPPPPSPHTRSPSPPPPPSPPLPFPRSPSSPPASFSPSPQPSPPPWFDVPHGKSVGISASLPATAHLLGWQQWCVCCCAGHCMNPDWGRDHDIGVVRNPGRSTCLFTDNSLCRSSRDYVHGIWARNVTRTLTVSTCVDGVVPWDTVLYVYRWRAYMCSCPSDAISDDDGGVCGQGRSSVTFTAPADTYHIVVVEGRTFNDNYGLRRKGLLSMGVSRGEGRKCQSNCGGEGCSGSPRQVYKPYDLRVILHKDLTICFGLHIECVFNVEGMSLMAGRRLPSGGYSDVSAV